MTVMRIIRPSILVVFSASLVLAGTGCGKDNPGQPGHQWDARVQWVFQADAVMYYCSPALSADESRVYIGTSTGYLGALDPDNAFYALAASDGKVVWRFPLGYGEVRSAPAVADDGSIYFMVQRRGTSVPASTREHLYHLSAAGDSLWAFDINAQPRGMAIGLSAPAIGPDGTVYIAGDALYAIRPDGSLKWKALPQASQDLRNSPSVAADGTVYFVHYAVPLTALDPADGHTIWSLSLSESSHFVSAPSLGADGTIYVGSDQGLFYAASAAGALQWTFDPASIGYSCSFRSSPAVAADGTIYVGTNSGNPASLFLALTPAGAARWTFTPANLPPDVPPGHFDIYSSPAIGSDGTVYFAQELGRVYALDPADGFMEWLVHSYNGITWCSPALAADGTLFISDLSGRVFAIQTDSRGLQEGAGWPRYRHDNRGRGRAG